MKGAAVMGGDLITQNCKSLIKVFIPESNRQSGDLI